MATALEKDDDNISNVLTCTLCNEELKTPKLLPCQHSFCTQCLLRYHDEIDEGKPFLCPSCKLDTEMADSTLKNLPDNFLYDIVKEYDGSIFDTNVKCTPCSEGKEITSATHKCLDCGDTLCQHCNDWHCRFTATKHHVIVSLTDFREGKFQDEFFTRKVRYCDQHSTNDHKVSLSSYCIDCRCLVCIKCIETQHNGHDFGNIHTVREKHQNSHGKIINMSQRNQSKRIKNFEKAIIDTKDTWNQQETEIYDTATELYTLVDKIKEEKLAELKAHYEEEIQNLTELLDEEKKKHSSLQASIDFTKMFLEKSSDSDFLYHEHDVTTRMESSQKEQSHIFKRAIVAIEKQEIQTTSQSLDNAFGRIETQEKCFLHKGEIGQVKIIFKQNISIKEVYGLSYNTNDNEIFVAGSSEARAVNVFNVNGLSKRMIYHEKSSADVHVKDANIVYIHYHKTIRKVVKGNQLGTVIKSMMLPDDDQDFSSQLGLVVDNGNTVFISSCAM